MVAEKRGVIRFFSVDTQQPILSLDCGQMPLLAADWSCSNLLRVAAVAANEWFLFDTSRSRWVRLGKVIQKVHAELTHWGRDKMASGFN